MVSRDGINVYLSRSAVCPAIVLAIVLVLFEDTRIWSPVSVKVEYTAFMHDGRGFPATELTVQSTWSSDQAVDGSPQWGLADASVKKCSDVCSL